MKESREPEYSALILAKPCADPSGFCQRRHAGSTDWGLGLVKGWRYLSS